MSDRKSITRRKWIAGCSAAIGASLAGCSGDGGDGDETAESTPDDQGTSDRETETREAGGNEDTPTSTEEFDAVATAGGSWPMYGQDSRNTAGTMEYTGPSTDVETAWTRDVHELGVHILADGRLYFDKEDGKFVEAVDPRTGERLWETEMRYERLRSLVYYDGVVYNYDGPLVGLDAETGEKAFELDTLYGDLIPQDGVMYIVSGNGNLAAIDLESGEEHWVAEHESELDTNWGGAISPGGTLVVPGKNGIRGFGTESGERIWTNEFGDRIPRYVSIDDDVAYFTHEEDGRVVAAEAIRVADGESLWTYEDEDLAGPLTLGHGNVYAGHYGDSGILALDAESGEELSGWSTEMGAVYEYVTNLMPRVQMAGDSLYAWEDDTFGESNLTCVDAHTGDVQWKSGHFHGGPPLLNENSVFFSTVYEGTTLTALTTA